MARFWVIGAAALALCACSAPAMVPYHGPYLTYSHGTAMGAEAMEYADAYCQQAGRFARPVADFPSAGQWSLEVTRYECISAASVH